MTAHSRPDRPEAPRDASRRSALAGLGAAAVAVVVAACSEPSTSAGRPARTVMLDPDGPRSPAAPDAPAGSPGDLVDPDAGDPDADAAGLPTVSRWAPGPGEVQPEIKAVAARLVEVAGTWGEGAGGVESAASRLSAAGFDPALAAALSRLLDDRGERAVVDILYPQYGGLTAAEASVMVALEQALVRGDGTTSSRGMTLDVRLASSANGWSVVAVGPDQPAPGPGAPTPLGESVLANPRVLMPADARADVSSGTVLDPVLVVLDGLSRDHTIEVNTFVSGHPVNIFGTDRQSNHSRGRAVDIWRVDGALVVDPATPQDLLAMVMIKAGQLGATEIGGPFDLNGERPRYFTDDLHRDHLHIGVSEGRSPAVP